jgi:membrane fusion protein (multidrug efflux system)
VPLVILALKIFWNRPVIKRFIFAIILLAIVVGGIVGFNMFRDQAISQFFAAMKPAPVTVSTLKVAPSRWTPGIEAIGTVGAASGVDLTVETTGVVKSVNFTANERVEKGRVLVQLEDDVQRADLEAANTALALNQRALERAEQLVRSGTGTQSALDAARAAAETSQADVSKLMAVLNQKQLVAPFSGVMGIPKVELGQFIQPGTIVASLQDLDTMRADFSIPELQLGDLSIGQPVSFGLDGYAEGFTGKITGIEPKIDSSSRLISVRASITDPNGKLSPGQFVQARVELPQEDNVIAIPDTALVTSLYGDHVYVVRTAEAKAAEPASGEASAAAGATPATSEPELTVRQVFVTAGRRSRGQVEIVKNLQVGDEIVTAGQNKLSNGTTVVVDNSVNLDANAEQAAQ